MSEAFAATLMDAGGGISTVVRIQEDGSGFLAAKN